MSNPLPSLVTVSKRNALPIAVALFAMAVACKKNDQGAAGNYQLGQTGGGAGGAPAGQAGMPGYVGGGAGAAAQAGQAGATAGGPHAQKLDAAAGAAVQPLLNQLAQKETQAGSKPVGETLVGNFAQGQTLETQIILQPNKCYSVVASALPPVTEVNVQLVLLTPLPGMAPILAVDQDSGPSAVLGKKATCYKWMLAGIPGSAKVVIQVTGGSGLVAAQAYEK